MVYATIRRLPTIDLTLINGRWLNLVTLVVDLMVIDHQTLKPSFSTTRVTWTDF